MAEELYVFRAGITFLSLKDIDAVEPEQESEGMKALAIKMNDCVAKSPIVADNPTTMVDPEKGFFVAEYREHKIPIFNSQIVFNVNWPRKNQDLFEEGHWGWGKYDGPVVEEFRIAFNGFCNGCTNS